MGCRTRRVASDAVRATGNRPRATEAIGGTAVPPAGPAAVGPLGVGGQKWTRRFGPRLVRLGVVGEGQVAVLRLEDDAADEPAVVAEERVLALEAGALARRLPLLHAAHPVLDRRAVG